MNRRTLLPAAALIGMTAWACDGPQLTDPTSSSPAFAMATRTPVVATIGPQTTLIDPGRSWTSADKIVHLRDQIDEGLISGDIVGTETVVFNVDFNQETLNSTAWGKVTIATAAGDWEGSFQGGHTAGVLAVNVVLHGSGGLEGLKLKGSAVETGPFTGIYTLTGEILNPGG